MSPQGTSSPSTAGRQAVAERHELHEPSGGAGGEPSSSAIAAGSGITPLMALARTLLAAHPETRVRPRLHEPAAHRRDVPRRARRPEGPLPGAAALHHVLSREQRIAPLLSGRIDAEKLQALLGTADPRRDVDEWFLCGPFELVQLCRDTLDDARRRARSTSASSCSPPASRTAPRATSAGPWSRTSPRTTVQIEFTLDGLSATVASPGARPRVDPERGAAGAPRRAVRLRRRRLRHLPRAWSAAPCTMTRTTRWSPTSSTRGYVLTCQSHPTTPGRGRLRRLSVDVRRSNPRSPMISPLHRRRRRRGRPGRPAQAERPRRAGARGSVAGVRRRR